MIETRSETCPDCHETRDREWVVKTVPPGAAAPKGYREEQRTGYRKVIAGRTRWVSLCACSL